MKNSSQDEKIIWHQLVGNYLGFSKSLKEFFSKDVDRVTIIRDAFRRGEIAPSLYVLKHMPTSESVQLFEELVKISTAHGYAGAAREIIFSLPREWVLSNIEFAIEPLLTEGIDDDYRRILELLIDLDHELTMKYVQMAIGHPKKEIQEVGQDFKERIDESKSEN